jgi:hypothetical protein
MAHVRLSIGLPTEPDVNLMNLWHKLSRRLFTRENLYALLICLALILLIILTADQAPQWIYQGF